MEKNNVVVVSAVRTPFGKFGGTLKDIPSIELGAMVIREVLRRANVKGEEVEDLHGFCPRRRVWERRPARQAGLQSRDASRPCLITLDRCCSSPQRLGFRAAKL
jgi:acetyl-CoA C-acetyltransferase